MAIGVLVLGESGTGKTYSMKNFKPEEIKIISVQKPILPFRGKYEIVKAPTGEEIIREMKNTDKKVIVIDDFQYVLGVQMMKRIGELGWQKFNEIEQPYSDVLDAINDLPDDTIVYLTSHVMYNDDTGKTQIKTVGKALDKYITIEGLFMIVLGTKVVDGKYYFRTQNDGANTLKSPEGMFPSLYIPNDLKYVDDHIRNYYYMTGAKSDEEMAKEDAEHKVDDADLKKGRRARKAKEEPNQDDSDSNAPETAESEPVTTTDENKEPEAEKPKKRERRKRTVKPVTEVTEEKTPDTEPAVEQPTVDNDTWFFIEADNNVVAKHAGDVVPDGGVEITKEQFNAAVKEIAMKGTGVNVKEIIDLMGNEEIPFAELENHPGIEDEIMPKPEPRVSRRGRRGKRS